MKKYFIVTDVHSFYDEMMTALTDAGYDAANPGHVFVSLGDLFDRGKKPRECLDFVNSIPEDRKILIRGNHEDLLEDALRRHGFLSYDYHNRTDETVNILYSTEHLDSEDVTPDFDKCEWLMRWEPYKQYIGTTQYYAIVGNYVFVHGWIPWEANKIEELENANREEWKSATWRNGMKSWHLYGPLENYIIMCGHFHTSYGHSRYHNEGVEFINPREDYAALGIENPYEKFDPFIDNGIIALDACTAYSGKVNCYVIEV